ncbi:hypothetical protein DYB32_000134 [Aphanomyces invadans]|uniref:Uncharacterized protein n=1 Tax=Aphanomyces invadans TaxID=157072 RepID=A0A3R6WUE9_9STRA|nr:hypothetical protein DYB32_000134 [Aphanomyces invadans]
MARSSPKFPRCGLLTCGRVGTEWHVQTQSLAFTAKYMFHQHPVRFAVAAFATTWVFASVVVEFFEHAINADIDSNVEAFWLLVLTMVRTFYGLLRHFDGRLDTQSTAGLGSTPPKSFQGQVAIALGGIVGGAVINALITTVLIESLRVTDAEESTVSFQASRHALCHLHKSTMYVLDRKTAAVKFRTTKLLSEPPAAHAVATMDALERKMHAVHSTLVVHSTRQPKGA